MTLRILPTTFAIAALLALGIPSDALAAKGGKAKKGGKKAGNSLAHFDKNHDGTIDSNESEALRAEYTQLAALDTDHDGKLSDSEIAAAKVGKGKGGKKKNAGKKKGGQKKAGKKAGGKKAGGKKGKAAK